MEARLGHALTSAWVVERRLVPDERDVIAAVLRQWKRPSGQLPPQTLPQAWRTLADGIDSQPNPEPVQKSN